MKHEFRVLTVDEVMNGRSSAYEFIDVDKLINNNNMVIDKDELYKLYMEWVIKVSDECDWKTHFYPEEIVYAIANILENNPTLIIKQ
jgi:hypothetical protein